MWINKIIIILAQYHQDMHNITMFSYIQKGISFP